MKINKRMLLSLAIWAGLAFPSIARADTVLEYRGKDGDASKAKTQSIAIKNDQIMIKAAGGDKNLDLLYRHASESVVIVDHRKRKLMTVDEQEVDRINQQAQKVQPLLQGLGKQVARLSPDKREKLQELLGDKVSLDTIARAAEPPVPTRLEQTGVKKVAGIKCRTVRVLQGETPIAQVCLADAAALKMSNTDAATIRALLDFYERLAAKSQGLAGQLGLTLPNISADEAAGIPIEFLDLSRENTDTITLHRIDTSPVSPKLMQIPSDYEAAPLSLWP
jgi:hypothetical protein